MADFAVQGEAAGQVSLFDADPSWKEQWVGMPDFEQKNLMPWQSVKVHFRNEEDRQAFAELIGQRITERTPFVWFPKSEIAHVKNMAYLSEAKLPRYPIYIISKGRWESRLTSKALEELGLEYFIVVEPQEYDNYAAVISPSKILTLPFSNLGLGSIPARNWVWENAVWRGAARHWILDDNIGGFCRLHQNLKVQVTSGTLFCAAEDFADRYTNVALCGFNYHFFAKRKQSIPPFVLNTRIYSCILIDNSIPYRWRGRYNEDTDLSLRALKDGRCTVLFNAFLAEKAATMTMKGGNTDELYKGDGRLKMAESLREQHPDVVTITEKWGRAQHHVNYAAFAGNKLHLRDGVVIDEATNNYGMELKSLIDPEANADFGNAEDEDLLTDNDA